MMIVGVRCWCCLLLLVVSWLLFAVCCMLRGVCRLRVQCVTVCCSVVLCAVNVVLHVGGCCYVFLAVVCCVWSCVVCVCFAVNCLLCVFVSCVVCWLSCVVSCALRIHWCMLAVC